MSDSPVPVTAVNSSEASLNPDPAELPTWSRYIVLAFLAAMAFILYLDRGWHQPGSADH